MVGHRTESIYRRYSIVDEAMLDIGTARLNELHKGLNDVKKASWLSSWCRRARAYEAQLTALAALGAVPAHSRTALSSARF